MKIIILGTGCPKCKTLEKLTRDAVAEMSLDAEITKEDDIMKIVGYGIMRTPGLVINQEVVLSGRLPSANEIKEILTKHS